jgi:hypothetical protein
MSSNGTPVKYITPCKLCNQRFSNNALPIVGDVPDASTRRFVEALIKHLASNHKPQFEEFKRNMVLLANQFAAWLALQSFEISDPNLQKGQEELRRWVHTLTRKHQLTDADLLDKISRLELAEPEAAHVNELCKEMRDYLTEQAQYGQPTGLVT